MSIDGLSVNARGIGPLSNDDERIDVTAPFTTEQGYIIVSEVRLTRRELRQIVTVLQSLNARFPTFDRCKRLNIKSTGGGGMHYLDGTITLDVKVPFDIRNERESIIHEYIHHILKSDTSLMKDVRLKRMFLASLYCPGADGKNMLAERYDESNFIPGIPENEGHPFANPSEFFVGAMHRMIQDSSSYHVTGRTPEEQRLDLSVLEFMGEHHLGVISDDIKTVPYTDDELAEIICALSRTIISHTYTEPSRGMFLTAMEGALSCLDALDPQSMSPQVRRALVRAVFSVCASGNIVLDEIPERAPVWEFLSACGYDGLNEREIARIRHLLVIEPS